VAQAGYESETIMDIAEFAGSNPPAGPENERLDLVQKG